VCQNGVTVAGAALNDKLSDIHADLSPALKLLVHDNITFRLSVSRVFQSVGLSPMVSEMNPNGPLFTYRGLQTPGSVRRDHFRSLEDQLIAKETQTIGGLLLHIEMC
jgi:hypothetical protein